MAEGLCYRLQTGPGKFESSFLLFIFEGCRSHFLPRDRDPGTFAGW